MNSDLPSSKPTMNHMNSEASLCSEVGNDWHGLSQLHTPRGSAVICICGIANHTN